MVHADTMAAAGLLSRADCASLRTERVTFSAIGWFKFRLRACLIEVCQCSIMLRFEALQKWNLQFGSASAWHLLGRFLDRGWGCLLHSFIVFLHAKHLGRCQILYYPQPLLSWQMVQKLKQRTKTFRRSRNTREHLWTRKHHDYQMSPAS